jgi:molecular chaperone DnaK (HSP70)
LNLSLLELPVGFFSVLVPLSRLIKKKKQPHKMRTTWTPLLLLWLQIVCVTSRAILGVDLGSLYMKVALVQSGSPLEIVTNLHSQRKTEQMVLFERQPNNKQADHHQNRFYGADAASLLARKSHLTPAAMSVLLGRDDEHPAVRVRTLYDDDTDTRRKNCTESESVPAV